MSLLKNRGTFKGQNAKTVEKVNMVTDVIYAEPLVSIIKNLTETCINDFSLSLSEMTLVKLGSIEEDDNEYPDMKLNYRNDFYRKDNKHIISCNCKFSFIGKDNMKYLLELTVDCKGIYILPEYDSYMHRYCYTYIVGVLKLDSRLTDLYSSDIFIPETLDCFDDGDTTRYDGYEKTFVSDSSIYPVEKVEEEKKENVVAFFEQEGTKLDLGDETEK